MDYNTRNALYNILASVKEAKHAFKPAMGQRHFVIGYGQGDSRMGLYDDLLKTECGLASLEETLTKLLGKD